MSSHGVFFILDKCFSGDLWASSRRAHVWLVGSDHNRALAQAVWDREAESYSPLKGVTTFDECEEPNETFYQLLGAIDEHHDEYGAPSSWDAIRVVGFPLEDACPDRIAEALGVDTIRLVPEDAGFAIRRLA